MVVAKPWLRTRRGRRRLTFLFLNYRSLGRAPTMNMYEPAAAGD